VSRMRLLRGGIANAEMTQQHILCRSCDPGMEEAMGRLVKPQEADYALHKATFIAKLPCPTPSAEGVA
jgi:hypothetical protein